MSKQIGNSAKKLLNNADSINIYADNLRFRSQKSPARPKYEKKRTFAQIDIRNLERNFAQPFIKKSSQMKYIHLNYAQGDQIFW